MLPMLSFKAYSTQRGLKMEFLLWLIIFVGNGCCLFFRPVDLASGFQENKKKKTKNHHNSAFSRSFIVKHNLRFQKLVVRRFWLPSPFVAPWENTEVITAIILLGTEGHLVPASWACFVRALSARKPSNGNWLVLYTAQIADSGIKVLWRVFRGEGTNTIASEAKVESNLVMFSTIAVLWNTPLNTAFLIC